MKLINKIIKITTRISALQNRYYYHWTKNLIDLNHHHIDILKQSSSVLERKKNNNLIRIISTITHKNEICSLTTFNEEELLWKLRLGILTGQDSNNFWKILQFYMKNVTNSQKISLSMKDIERIFLKF